MTLPDRQKRKKLYTVANAHLDTQWNWTIQDTIRDCVKNTLERNFALLDKYPHYRMNFEGAFRYQLAKEYYPALYEKLKRYIAEGRWNVAGSTWDAMDANVPSSEALMRQILYGNGFFEREFGKKSTDIFLTDCFGFRWSLPSIAAHMGLNGFSTQKLMWGVGSPIYEADGSVTKPMPDREKPRMDLGRWVGPDGNFVAVSLLEGDYTYNFDNNRGGEGPDLRPVNRRKEYERAIDHNERFTGHAVRSMYYGTGDYGGSCRESSARMVNDAVEENGSEDVLYDVVSASTDQIFNELTPEERAALPAYRGELLIPHGSGALTSHTISKRWNRKCELLGDAAERAAVFAAWLGTAEYPAERFLDAWQTFLWHQFHDDLPGTSIAAAYVFSYNDYVIAMNLFASELAKAVGGVARTLCTDVSGTPVVVYNPTSYPRHDLAEAALVIKTPYVRVFDGEGREVPAQLSRKNGKTAVQFVAETAPVSVTVFDVRESETPSPLARALFVRDGGRVLENQRYVVTIDDAGDIASIVDKENGGFELLSAPIRLEIGPDSSANWPSWELVWTDSLETPVVVGGKPEISVTEDGPAVVSVTVKRRYEGSTFVQTISLSSGGQRVDVANEVEWYQRKSNLRAAFPLAVSNPTASFDLGLGAIESGNTDAFPYYQHVVHQWADLTSSDGSYGVSILNDCKYGMDKPADNLLRLTLIHTPPYPFSEQSGQDWQDMGPNRFTYSVMGHKGFRKTTGKEAAALNQPLVTFGTQKHGGASRERSLVSVSDEGVVLRCVKKEEKGNRIIVRAQETFGKEAKNVRLRFVTRIADAVETNGYEESPRPASFAGDTLTLTLAPYGVKTFALTLERENETAIPTTEPLPLSYDRQVTTARENLAAGELANGVSIPAELYRETVTSGGVSFALGPVDGKNAMTARGQTLSLPAGVSRLYLLACSTNGDKTVPLTFHRGEATEQRALAVEDCLENVGSWAMLVNGSPCLVKRDEIAVRYTHTHSREGDRPYRFAYLFRYMVEVDGVDAVTLPEDENLLLFAASVGGTETEEAWPLSPLYDVAERPAGEKHRLTVLDWAGRVVEEREEYEGRLALLRTQSYRDGYVFRGWDCGDITADYGNAAVLQMPDHDVTARICAEKLGDDVLLHKPYTVSGEINEREIGAYALNGNDTSKWCSHSTDGVHWLAVDAGEPVRVDRWFVMHAGAKESVTMNTRDFRLEYRMTEEEDWKKADEVTGNEENLTVRSFAPVEGRYFRLWVDRATQGRDGTVRIYMFQVYRAQ